VARVQHVLSRHYGLAQVAIVLAAVWSYELLRRAIHPNWPLALEHAREIASWERVAHLEWEAPVQRAFLHAPELVRAMNLFYLAGHFVLTGLFFWWLYRRSQPAFRVFRNAFLGATAVALAVHAAFPTAPPRLAGLGLVDTLRRLSGIDIGSQASAAFSNPVAAVPSLHAGWALGVGVGVVLYARPLWAKLAGALYPAAVTLTILVTGNHFVFDALAGMAVMAASLSFGVVTFAQRRGVEQSGSSPGS
jgi:PAP2 superfamily